MVSNNDNNTIFYYDAVADNWQRYYGKNSIEELE
jgi:hypothetical protein